MDDVGSRFPAPGELWRQSFIINENRKILRASIAKFMMVYICTRNHQPRRPLVPSWSMVYRVSIGYRVRPLDMGYGSTAETRSWMPQDISGNYLKSKGKLDEYALLIDYIL